MQKKVQKNKTYKLFEELIGLENINKYFDEVEIEFHIFGKLGDNWLPYDKERDFEGYVVKRKN